MTYVSNKTEDLNLNVITGINESKTLNNHISWECKCKLRGTKCKYNQLWNSDRCWCECKKHLYVKKIMFRILLEVFVKMNNI